MTSVDFITANAQAVALLHQGAYCQAIRGLQGVMQILKDVSSQFDAEEDFNTDAAAVDEVHIQASQALCKLCNRDVQEGVFSFCARPMVLVGTHEQVMRSAVSQNRTASVLLFNLSLAYLCCSGFCDESDVLMKASLKISGMASDLISRLPRRSHGDSILYISSLNNQGFLHVYFASHEAANDSLERLELTLAAVAAEGNEQGLDLRTYQDVNDVICTVLWCQGRTVLVAAPAA